MDNYFWCPKCRALIHGSEVTLDKTHEVAAFLTADRQEKAIIHTGLRPEND